MKALNVKEYAVSPRQLRKQIDSSIFEFETTEEVPMLTSIVGQERGRAVMNFGLNVQKIGYNLYVAGIPGTGKTTFTHSIVNEFAKHEVELFDWCYVYNFDDAYKPKALQLPVGMGKMLQEDMENLIADLKVDIPRAFAEESYQKERSQILRDYNEKNGAIFEEIDEIARQHDFMIRQSGSGILTIPTIKGEPITEEEYEKLDQKVINEIEEKSSILQEKVLDYTEILRKIEKETKQILEKLEEKVVLTAVDYHVAELKKKFRSCEDIIDYLDTVLEDILKNRSDFLEEEKVEEPANPLAAMFPQRRKQTSFNRYQVNLLVDNSETEGAPVISADNPTFYNLIGKVEYESRMGVMSTNFTKIKPGYLHHANGGYLIIQAREIFTKSYAWEGLKRALLHEQVQIENLAEHTGVVTTTSLSPDPIPVNLKVILIGNVDLYQLLYHYDEDFRKLFKIKADFDVEMDASLENMTRLASFIHTHCEEQGLLNFHRSAVARVVEYSTRLVGNQRKLSTRFNEQVDIIYEADTWAKMAGAELVTNEHVVKAIQEREYRNNLYEEKVQESMEDGSILIDTDGAKVGQVNGLAVYNLGQYSFGKPSRITATTFVGQKGIINIERESKLSGNIHNKGVYILAGYLGEKFAQKHPLTLTAHLAFEQSYGGVDGDSASSTELYALLSSLSEVPIKQGIAVTGSVNQKGEIQPIGGVNEKIEGFFDLCKKQGLTGEQAVLIPAQNVENLMVKEEVVEAVRRGDFHVYAVRTIEEGISILTGEKAGRQNEDGSYEADTIFEKVAKKLAKYDTLTNKQSKQKE